MTIDTTRLRALAEAAANDSPPRWATDQEWEGQGVMVDRADATYLAAIDPPTLIALLDELEALRDDDA